MRSFPLLLLTACAPGSGAMLVDALAWEPADALDPAPDHRLSDQACSSTGWGEEIGGLEVSTGDCPYGVFSQPLLRDVREGRTVSVLAWHSDLVSESPAEGHLLLTVGNAVLVDWFVDIPSRADVLDVEVTAPVSFAAGAPVVVHVHNHGTNTWNLNAVSL